MEITSFLLGVCIVIMIVMVMGVSVNYKAIKVLKDNIDYLEHESSRSFTDVYRDLEKIEDKVYGIQQDLLNTITKETVEINKSIESRYDKLYQKSKNDFTTIYKDLDLLDQKIERVEKGYKEKINY